MKEYDRAYMEAHAGFGPLDPEDHRLIPQSGVRQYIFPDGDRHNAIWDYYVTPDKRHLFSVCAEGDFAQGFSLYEYFPETNTVGHIFDFDDRITEAAYDLGAGPWYAFFHVELPILLPGIVAGGLLAFTLSIDDVVITSFVNGAGTNTFPTYVSSMTKHSRNLPSVFALSTLMLLFTCALVGISKLLTANSQPKGKAR